MKETKCVDQIKCPYCNKKFSYEKTSCADSDYEVECPKCEKTMRVMESVEYLAQTIDE